MSSDSLADKVSHNIRSLFAIRGDSEFQQLNEVEGAVGKILDLNQSKAGVKLKGE